MDLGPTNAASVATIGGDNRNEFALKDITIGADDQEQGGQDWLRTRVRALIAGGMLQREVAAGASVNQGGLSQWLNHKLAAGASKNLAQRIAMWLQRRQHAGEQHGAAASGDAEAAPKRTKPASRLSTTRLVTSKVGALADIVGKRVEIWWEGDNCWYAGVVTGERPKLVEDESGSSSGDEVAKAGDEAERNAIQHEIAYDDGENEWIALAEHQWRLVKQVPASKKRKPRPRGRAVASVQLEEKPRNKFSKLGKYSTMSMCVIAAHAEHLSEGGQTSLYHGVRWEPSSKKWAAQIKCNGVCHDLGLFVDELAAAKAYDEVARSQRRRMRTC